MSKENRKLLDDSNFSQRVNYIIEQKGITLDSLAKAINNNGYDISKSNLSSYLKRVPNVNFLIALSKSLSVSCDCLLGLKSMDSLEQGFNYDYDSHEYSKYNHNEYKIYFLPTVNNSLEEKEVDKVELCCATMKIYHDVDYNVELKVPTNEKESKEYEGKLIISKSYDISYVFLKGKKIGEIIFLSFLDPNINGNVHSVETLVGLSISVSAGTLRRAPVMSRFILSKKEIPEEKKDAIIANLKLNTKFIDILDEDMKTVLKQSNLSPEVQKKVFDRLNSAFPPKSHYSIEESYILNTIKTDFKLSFEDANQLLNLFRIFSLSPINNKLYKSVDSRLFKYINNTEEK